MVEHKVYDAETIMKHRLAIENWCFMMEEKVSRRKNGRPEYYQIIRNRETFQCCICMKLLTKEQLHAWARSKLNTSNVPDEIACCNNICGTIHRERSKKERRWNY